MYFLNQRNQWCRRNAAALHYSTAPSALGETFLRVGQNDICTCNCSSLHAEKSEENGWFCSKQTADLILKCWTIHRDLFARSQHYLASLVFLFVPLSASQWSSFIRKSPSLCISITTHTHTWAPAVLPSGETISVNSSAWCRNWLILERSYLSTLFLYIAFL